MAYKKTDWRDTLRDAQGNVIQRGTPLNAQALGKIEDGIVAAEQKIDTEIQQVTTQLAQKTKVITDVILDNKLERKSSAGSGELVPYPDFWTWDDVPLNIYEKNGSYYTDFDAANFIPETTGTVYYVDPVAGSDNNDGLTLAKAFKSLIKAKNANDVSGIWLASGMFKRNELFGEFAYDKNIWIRAIDGANVVCSCHDDLTWTLASGMVNTYQTTRSSTDWVWDSKFKDANGDNVKYTLKASIQEVEATKGSYYINGSTVYVHAIDDRSLIGDKDIRVYLGTINFRFYGGSTVYLEGISFEGGRFVLGNSPTALNPLFIAKNCKWKYVAGNNEGGLTVTGGDVYLQNCVAACNIADGFNYHASNGVINHVIEVDCIGRNNGKRNTPLHQDNGSTMHDGGKIVRLNGYYYQNEGPNIADVNTGTESFAVGCTSVQSRSTVNGADFRIRDTGAFMELLGCVTTSSNKIESSGGASLNVLETVVNAEIESLSPLTLSVPTLVNSTVAILNAKINNLDDNFNSTNTLINDLQTKTVHSSGVNANGQWLRFQDGTQIAITGLISLNGESFITDGALFRSSNTFTVTFPNDFVGASYQVMVTPRRLGGDSAVNRVWATMHSASSFLLYKTNDTPLTDCGYVATIIGRWK